MAQNLKLSAIRADQRAQPRAELHMEKIGEYVEDMQRGDEFPPLVVFHDGALYWLADGFHRFYAATSAEKSEFPCEVFQGGLREAILYSCSANATHGLRRTSKDKQRAVAKLLEDEEWSKWSDREIARRCSVTPTFVGKIRREIENHTVHVDSMERTFTHHKTGEPAVMRFEPRSAPALAPAKPSAAIPSVEIARHLHEIRRHIDAMPEPKAAVANFPEDQWLMFPLSTLESMAGWMTEFAAQWRERIKANANAAA